MKVMHKIYAAKYRSERRELEPIENRLRRMPKSVLVKHLARLILEVRRIGVADKDVLTEG